MMLQYLSQVSVGICPWVLYFVSSLQDHPVCREWMALLGPLDLEALRAMTDCQAAKENPDFPAKWAILGRMARRGYGID